MSRGFLADHPGARSWSLADGNPGGFTLSAYYLGPGDSPLEVAVAETPHSPSAPDVRTLWQRRQGGTPSPLPPVVLYPASQPAAAATCGPTGDPPTSIRDLNPANLERIGSP